MKILGIVPYRFLPAQIGGQKAIEQLYRSLGKRVPVTVVSTDNNDRSEAQNFSLVPIMNTSALRYANITYAAAIGKCIRQKKITHLFTEHPYLGWLVLWLKKRHHLPLIIHSHNIESTRFKSIGKKWWKLLWYYERSIYNAADFVFFMTEADRQYAINQYHLPRGKAFVASYGIEVSGAPSIDSRAEAKQKVCEALQLSPETNLLLFNGSFDYAPNARALEHLLYEVVPQLDKGDLLYKLIICGRNISRELKAKAWQNVIFLDYVEDIFLYNLAADVFVNPVMEGGGIKTKLVEALAAGANAVSVRSGAVGVEEAWCNGKLYICDDADWTLFAGNIGKALTNKNEIGKEFYKHFFIDNIADFILKTISAK